MDWLTWWDGFPAAFALTCLIEVPAYLLGWASLGWVRRRSAVAWSPLSGVGLALLVNVISHPLLWFTARSWPELVLLLELAVVLIEGLVVALLVRRRFGSRRDSRAGPGWAWLVALGVNALSILAGAVVLTMIIDGLSRLT